MSELEDLFTGMEGWGEVKAISQNVTTTDCSTINNSHHETVTVSSQNNKYCFICQKKLFMKGLVRSCQLSHNHNWKR